MVQGVDEVYLMSVSRGATMQGRFRKDVYVNYLKNTQKYTLIKTRYCIGHLTAKSKAKEDFKHSSIIPLNPNTNITVGSSV